METRSLKEANAALDELVQEIARLQDGDGAHHGLVTDYVLIYASQAIDDDGEDTTALGYAYPSGSQPVYRTLGLLDCMRTLLRKRWSAEDD
jgi:hypothetical protein